MAPILTRICTIDRTAPMTSTNAVSIQATKNAPEQRCIYSKG